MTYVLLQWFLIGEIKDSIFIGILVGANDLNNLDLSKIDQLIQFKERIESLSTWPGTFKIIRTTIGIIIISILPVAIQILLEHSFFSLPLNH